MVRPTALESPHGAVGKATSLIRSRGCSEHVGVHLEQSGSVTQRRVIRDRGATINAAPAPWKIVQTPGFVVIPYEAFTEAILLMALPTRGL
jgi:hypothetical protein